MRKAMSFLLQNTFAIVAVASRVPYARCQARTAMARMAGERRPRSAQERLRIRATVKASQKYLAL
jgi:hypothetical protein